jgi:hypothetical protein
VIAVVDGTVLERLEINLELMLCVIFWNCSEATWVLRLRDDEGILAELVGVILAVWLLSLSGFAR